eukprot:gnl/TRDRNA2_/TRDRNA2_197190_c0_seq1.p1 gnl/TRDRNA2_/TRDRNA2_197190_c0~~gnl/TRDRNA2_/TRDRNA2_197190_c0_seq1.p1  ORF type:complete len:357 (+),score=77.34 gnl/TRDRNA2_/TRDRNA2_197190_c0_seq1:30-1100(+)
MAARAAAKSPKSRRGKLGVAKKVKAAPRSGAQKKSTPKKAGALLIDLGRDLVRGTIVRRPSRRNRSPYVGDVKIKGKGAAKREAIAHMPSMDMGGKSVAGADLLMKPARDRKGNVVGSKAVSKKYGTPCCEFIAQLLRVDEGFRRPLWIGAHPSLGEKIAEELLRKGICSPELPRVATLQSQVTVAGCDMRSDFLITPATRGRRMVVEVKTVVDTDYPASSVPNRTKCVFVSHEVPYRRAGIFPWGEARQKGPDGETVVSERAIRHVDELAAIARGERRGANGERFDAAILFIVIRDDAVIFRPNVDACPSFAKHLAKAKKAGVKVLAQRVRWGEKAQEEGQCFADGALPVVWPKA